MRRELRREWRGFANEMKRAALIALCGFAIAAVAMLAGFAPLVEDVCRR